MQNVDTPIPIRANGLASETLRTQFRRVMRHWWAMSEERPGDGWMYLLATFIYNCVFGVVLTVIFVLAIHDRAPVLDTLWETLFISNCIGFSIHGVMYVLHRWTMPTGFAQWSQWKKRATYVAAMLVGVYAGYTIAFAAFGRNFTALFVKYPRAALGLFLIGGFGCLIWYLIMEGQTRRLRAEADVARNSEIQQRLTAQARDAELRALQAQIEPHFLFNTLANVQALIDYEPQKAKQMLDAFILHLRMSLDVSRQTQSTLGTELQFVKTYLQLLEIRMGARLRYRIECAPDLRSIPLAPLLLQPLVENAVKYGIEPKIDGGEIVIRVVREDAHVVLCVTDDGIGIGHSSTAKAGAGAGMKNVRDRLASLYGDRATLNITAISGINEGSIAIIRIRDNNTDKPL